MGAPPGAEPGSEPPALEFSDFGLAHPRPGSELVLLEGVDLVVPASGFYLMVGESGGGKSSLLRLIAGLLDLREPPPRIRGQVRVLGRSLGPGYPQELRNRVAAILQEEGLLDDLSPRANVELALRAAGRSPKLALALLAQAGLDPPPERVAVLSGGMRKRLAVARALAAEPDLLICDEPTAGLDPEASVQLARLLHDSHLRSDGRRTTLVITHDLQAFEGLADGYIVVDRNRRTMRLLPPDSEWKDTAAAAAISPGQEEEPAALHGLRKGMLGLAGLADTLARSLLRLPPVEPVQVARTTLRFLLEPALFVVLAAAVIGGLATFFALRNNPIEGAFESAVLTGSGKVLTAVLVPLLAGFFFTARMAAGAAARLGTMKRSHQISALTMMGIQPADYLLTPLVWAMTLAMPVITLAACVAAALASLAAARVVSGISTYGWAAHYFFTVDARDLRLVFLKACLSGYLVAVATYHLATGPKRSGREVGDAVNASIVSGMALVLVVHSLITFWCYS